MVSWSVSREGSKEWRAILYSPAAKNIMWRNMDYVDVCLDLKYREHEASWCEDEAVLPYKCEAKDPWMGRLDLFLILESKCWKLRLGPRGGKVRSLS